MRRKPGEGITEEARAVYQANVIDLVNELLDSMSNRVNVEFMQHRGDIGHEKTNEISTHYGLVKVPSVSGHAHDRLRQARDIAQAHSCNLSVGEDAALVFWVPSPTSGGGVDGS